MVINAEVNKNQNETNISLIRRFSKRLRNSSTLTKARALRFHTRNNSKLKIKERALKRIEKRKKIEKMRKMGKM